MARRKGRSPSPVNPTGNQLHPAAGENALLAAITKSGYPLETVVAARLKRRRFHIEEEWPYTDSDSGEERAMDLHAARRMTRTPHTTEKGELGVFLHLIIECKASDLPFVAFESVEPPQPPDYPSLTGLPHLKIDVYRNASEGRYRPTPVQELLGFRQEPFMRTPPIASSLSRAERRGKTLELSGEQPFRALALPLTKALDFHRRAFAARKLQRERWWAHCAIAIAVVDAPLTLAGAPTDKATVRPVPWVRLVRRHALDTESRSAGRSVSMLEIVHRQFFDGFVDDYVVPVAQVVSKKLLKHQDVVIGGKAVVPNLDWDKPGLPGIVRIQSVE